MIWRFIGAVIGGCLVVFYIVNNGVDAKSIAPVIWPRMTIMHPTGLGCMDNLIVVTLGHGWFYKLDANGHVIACGEAHD